MENEGRPSLEEMGLSKEILAGPQEIEKFLREVQNVVRIVLAKESLEEEQAIKEDRGSETVSSLERAGETMSKQSEALILPDKVSKESEEKAQSIIRKLGSKLPKSLLLTLAVFLASKAEIQAEEKPKEAIVEKEIGAIEHLDLPKEKNTYIDISGSLSKLGYFPDEKGVKQDDSFQHFESVDNEFIKMVSTFGYGISAEYQPFVNKEGKKAERVSVIIGKMNEQFVIEKHRFDIVSADGKAALFYSYIDTSLKGDYVLLKEIIDQKMVQKTFNKFFEKMKKHFAVKTPEEKASQIIEEL